MPTAAMNAASTVVRRRAHHGRTSGRSITVAIHGSVRNASRQQNANGNRCLGIDGGAADRPAVRNRTVHELLVSNHAPDYASRMSEFDTVLIIDDDADVLRAARIALTSLVA